MQTNLSTKAMAGMKSALSKQEPSKEEKKSPLDAAIDTMRKAVSMHSEHLKNPKSATPESQQQMMGLMVASLRFMASAKGEGK